jgi:ATP-dependent protease HslVU (ClpYQ) peptidase subunit
MSVVVAVRTKTDVCVAWDSRWVSGGVVLSSSLQKVVVNDGEPKLVVSVGGPQPTERIIFDIIEGLVSEHKNAWTEAWFVACAEAKEGTALYAITHRSDANCTSFLVVNGDQFVTAHFSGAAFEHGDKVAVYGCGREVALGAATALLAADKNAHAYGVAREAARVATELNHDCGGPIKATLWYRGRSR